MKIELRNIKYHPDISEDTPAYSARIYLEGLQIAYVSNQGHGGPDEIRAYPGKQATLDRVEEWCKLQPPILSHGMSLPYDLELKCGELLSEHLALLDMKKAMKRRVLTRTRDGKMMEYSWKGVQAISDKHIEHIRAQHTDEVILNTLPLDDALKLYMEVSV